jgi:hypothetical protein
MFAIIQAVNEENDTGDIFEEGRRFKVNTPDITISAHGGTVHVEANCQEDIGDGTRGGTPTTIVRRLHLALDVQELIRIINASVEGYVIAFDPQNRVIPCKPVEFPTWFTDMSKK